MARKSVKEIKQEEEKENAKTSGHSGQKKKSIIILENTSLFILIRTEMACWVNESKNMLPTIMKCIINNFEVSYRRITDKRPTRGITEDNKYDRSDSITITMRRCYVEDVMALSPGTNIVLLIPSSHKSLTSIWSRSINNIEKSGQLLFGKCSYHKVVGQVRSAP